VAFARTLPYTGFVTEMGSNGVRALQTGRPLHTGLQAHGVDVLDSTPYAYVTKFGAEPGTVSQIDVRTMRSSDLSMLDLRSGAIRRIAFPGANGFEPHGIDIAEDGRTLYVACAGGAWIYIVDARTLRPGRVVVTAPGANMRGVKLAHAAGRGADDRHRWRQPRRPLAKALD
jgi:DNA-binding beta-propeller fold protein YncE